MKTQLLSIVVFTAITTKAEVAFTSIFQPFPDYPNIGEIQTPNEYGGFGVPFRTGGGEYDINSVTLEHLTFGNPNSGPVNIQLYKDINPDPFSTVADAEFLGSLSYTGTDPRDTRWPGSTTFDRYEPAGNLHLDASTDYFLFITSGPSGTADLVTFIPTPNRTASIPDWIFKPHFGGDLPRFFGVPEVAFELDVTTVVQPPGSSVPDAGSVIALMAIGFAALGSAGAACQKIS
jgi:hypothetical protein